MNCKKCGSPMYYPSPSGLCPECESKALDKLAEQEAAKQKQQPKADAQKGLP